MLDGEQSGEKRGIQVGDGGTSPPTGPGAAGTVDEASRWIRCRRVPHERVWSVGLRTVHVMAFGFLLGGHAADVEAARLVPALAVTLASGAGLMGLEVYRTAHWILMGKGVAVLVKLGLLLLVPLCWTARVPLLLAVVAVASVGAHMPARYRHYSLLRRRVLDVQTAVAGEPPAPTR